MTLADLPELRGAPDVDPRECIPSLAGKPHGHFLCDAWRRGDFAAPAETRRLVTAEVLYVAPRRVF